MAQLLSVPNMVVEAGELEGLVQTLEVHLCMVAEQVLGVVHLLQVVVLVAYGVPMI